MFSFTSQSRKSGAILAAGAAALLITGLGVATSNADTLQWCPAISRPRSVNGRDFPVGRRCGGGWLRFRETMASLASGAAHAAA